MQKITSLLKDRQALLFASLFLLTVSLWGRTLTFDFVLDDHALIVENPTVKDIRFLSYHGTHGIYPPVTPRQANYGRPLFMGTLMADYAVWRLNPAGFHLTNLLLHFLNVWFVFLFVRRLWGRERPAFAAAALFCAAPVHASVVGYVSGRADLLAAFFVLASLTAFLSWRTDRRLGWYRISLACFALGLFSRENALLLLPLLPLVRSAAVRTQSSRTQDRLEFAGFIAVGLLYVLARQLIFSGEVLGRLGQTHLPWGITLLNVVNVLGRYARLLVWPHPLVPMRTTPWVLQPTAILVAGSVLFALIVAGTARLFIKKKTPWTFGPLWACVCLIVLVRLIDSFPGRGAAMAENWLYLPLVGVCATLGVLMARFQKTYPALLVLAVFYWGTFALRETPSWRNDTALLEQMQRYTPPGPGLTFQEGALLLRQGRLDEAFAANRQILDDETYGWRAANQLGVIARRRGHPEKALSYFERSVRQNPANVNALTQIASLRLAAGDEAGMLDAIEQSLEQYLYYPESYLVLGNWYLGKQDFLMALRTFGRALSLDPDSANGYVGVAMCLQRLRRNDEAAETAGRALRRARLNAGDYKNLGALFANMGRFDEAITLWKKGLTLSPDDAEIRAFISSAQAAMKE